MDAHELEKAIAASEEALKHARHIGDRKEEAFIDRVIGNAFSQKEDYTEAIICYERSIVILEDLNRDFDLGSVLVDHARALILAGKIEQAHDQLALALTIFTQLQLPLEQKKVQELLASIE